MPVLAGVWRHRVKDPTGVHLSTGPRAAGQSTGKDVCKWAGWSPQFREAGLSPGSLPIATRKQRSGHPCTARSTRKKGGKQLILITVSSRTCKIHILIQI